VTPDPSFAAAGAASQRLRRRSLGAHGWQEQDDLVAREEPLEIQLGAASLAVVMRTPGHDEELALGFAVTERIVASAADIVSVHHCANAASEGGEDNVIRIVPAAHVELDLERLRRNLFASSSCGICGKATIENALATAPPLVGDAAVFAASVVRTFPALLRQGQDTFDATGGLHAAALFTGDGRLLALREDVGRHNAVDKIVGWAAQRGLLPLSGHALMVSGRVSYEIVQKALAARIPLVAAISAPTSLAVELAEQAGIGLVGFLRGDTMNVYANAFRVNEA
jgi:FdhD protein